ncbi:MAG: hypothetical protein K2W85_06920 [Phycisphaerales bacterium]|nr:hypothetical protein [Phycisphaerales bacterium]
MWQTLSAWYGRRIVNVNINVVVAGLLALVPVLACVKLTEWALSRGIVDGERLHVSDKVIIGVVTFLSDIIFDVAIYYGLHWLANHAPWLKKTRLRQLEAVADAAVDSSPFFKDATRVQMQRMVLSPLLYVLWIGTQQTLMHAHLMPTSWATVIGFCVGVGVARALHTYWMIQEERARKAAIAAGKPVPPPTDPLGHKHPVWERTKPDGSARAGDSAVMLNATGETKGGESTKRSDQASPAGNGARPTNLGSKSSI